jgi:hypothetical protein
MIYALLPLFLVDTFGVIAVSECLTLFAAGLVFAAPTVPSGLKSESAASGSTSSLISGSDSSDKSMAAMLRFESLRFEPSSSNSATVLIGAAGTDLACLTARSGIGDSVGGPPTEPMLSRKLSLTPDSSVCLNGTLGGAYGVCGSSARELISASVKILYVQRLNAQSSLLLAPSGLIPWPRDKCRTKPMRPCAKRRSLLASELPWVN